MPHSNKQHMAPQLEGKKRGQIVNDGSIVAGVEVVGKWEWNGKRWVDITPQPKQSLYTRDMGPAIEVGDGGNLAFVQQSDSVSGGRATNPTTLIDNVPVFDLGPGVSVPAVGGIEFIPGEGVPQAPGLQSIVRGCMDKKAINYNPNATVADNTSCIYTTVDTGPLSETPNLTVVVKANRDSQILIDGKDSQKRTSSTFVYTAKELLSGKTFKVQSGENYKSKDTYKVAAVKKFFEKQIKPIPFVDDNLSISIDENERGVLNETKNFGNILFPYYEFQILKNGKPFRTFGSDYKNLLQNQIVTLDFNLESDAVRVDPKPVGTKVFITSNVSSNDIIRYRTSTGQTNLLLTDDEVELTLKRNADSTPLYIEFFGVGIDETTHTVTYSFDTPNKRATETINTIDYKLELQEGTTNITVDTVKVPKEKPIDIPLLNVSSNKFKYNINTKESLKISYNTLNADRIEYSLGKTKREEKSSGTIVLSEKDFLNGVGTYTLYVQARNKIGGSDVEKITIIVESREFIPGPDITNINYPQNIQGADFKEFNVPFDISWQSINTDYIRVYAGKYNPQAEKDFFLGQFGKSGKATFTVEDVLRVARRQFDEDDNILQFQLFLIPFNAQGDSLTSGKVEKINITFDKGDLTLRRGNVIGDIRKAFEYCFDYSQFDEHTSPLLTHYLHLGDGENKLISTYGIDDETFSEYTIVDETNERKKIKEEKTIVLKLYEPLEGGIDVNDKIWISKIQSIPLIDQITILDDVSSDCIPLTPNLSLELNDDIGYQIYDDLIASGSTSSEAVIQEFVSGSGFSLDTLELEYTSGSGYQWGNFVKYSSAKERVANFYYKMKLLESYRSKHELLATATGSAGSVSSQNEQRRVLGKMSEIKQNFDAFEKHLYTVSGSLQYPKSGTSNIKLTDTGSILNPTGSEAINWYNTIYATASAYDRDNPQRLVNNLPAHIQDDAKGQEFILFFDMVGQHFDILYHYIKRLSKSKKTENKFKDGIISDLMYEMLSSLGWDADLGISSETLWEYAFGEHSDGTQVSTMSGKDRQQETWRRILNNLPYLYKHKGTKRAIHAALSIYGIPNSMLTIMEFGGPKDNTTSRLVKYSYDDTTSALNISGSQQLIIPWKPTDGNYPQSVELRVETNTKQSQTLVSSSGWSLDLNYISGSSAKLQLNVLSGSTYYSESTETFPYFNQDYTQIVVNRTSGSSSTFEFFAKEGFQERIRNQVSASFTIGNNNGWRDGSELLIGGMGISGSSFTGSVDEIRLWNTPLSQSRIDNHALNGDAIDGNHSSSSTEDLLLRVDFENPRNLTSTGSDWRNTYVSQSMVSDGLTSLSGSLESVSPITTYANFITASNFPSASYPYGFTFYDRRNTSNVPSVGLSVGDKIRFEEQTLTSNLSYRSRGTKKSFDQSPLDSDKLGLFFSPAKELNLDIVKTIGDFSIDDLIGDPSDYYEDGYTSLDRFRNYYFSRYNVDFHEYIQLVRYIDKSLFKLLETLVPARAKVTTGLLIEPHMLERSKIKRSKPTGSNDQYETSIGIQDEMNVTSSKDDYTAELDTTNITILSGSKHFHEGEILEAVSSSLVGTKDNYQSIISASDNFITTGDITRNSGSDMAGFDIRIEAVISQSVQGEYDSTAYQQIGMDPNSLTVAGFGLYGSGSNAIITKLDKDNNFVRERSKVFLIKESYTVDVPQNINSNDSSLGTELVSQTRYRHFINILPFTGSNGSESTDPSVTGNVVEVKPLNGAFASHYINTGDLTTGLENSYFNGSKQTAATTLDGSSPIQTFTTNPNTLKVNDGGRGSGEPILEVE